MDTATVNVYRVELTPKATNVCWLSSAPVEIVLTNSYTPGGITWSGTNGLNVVSADNDKLIFLPTNSVATNYAVKATATDFPNGYDVCTVNVYRVELTPRTTNVWWQTTNQVEIVLTNSYALGGITWSGTNGLKVVSATDAKLVFTPTNSTATNYAVKATATGFPNCYDVCTVNVYRVELTPDATNVCWLSSNPVEIVLTNSYAPGGITWSGTNGLKVVSATDAKLVFTPTNSAATNYAVKATATGFPNCYDVCTVNVYRVELTPRTTNVWWQTSIPVEIVLTNSYAPGGITWSGTNGLKVVSATDAKLVFTPTNSVATNYAVKATATAFTNCYDICVVSVMKVELDGLRVYDPKLENAGNSEITYKIYGPASGFMPRLELTVMDGATEVACVVRKTDASPVIGAGITTNWDGKWGTTKAGTNTAHKGKLADPKQYKMELMVYESAAATTATWTNKFDLYVVRLGTLTMRFLDDQEVTYHKQTSADLPGLTAIDNFPFTDPTDFDNDVVWKMEHIDFLKTAGPVTNTETRIEQTPTGESYTDTDNVAGRTGTEQYFDEDGDGVYTVGLRQSNFPPQTPTADKNVSGGIESARYNRPAVYVRNSPIKIACKFGTQAKSDVTLADCAVGYPVAALPICVVGKFGGADMGRDNSDPATDGDAMRNINPVGGPYKLKSTATLTNTVGYGVETIAFTFKYNKTGESYVDANGNGAYDTGETVFNDNGNGTYDEELVDIPGKQTTTHLIYRLAAGPTAQALTGGRLWLKIVDFTCKWANGQTTPEQVFDKIWNTDNFWTPFVAGPKPDNANGFHGVGDPAETTRADMWGNNQKCYSYQHNMGNNNGFDVDWLLDFNQGRCGAWAPFLLAFMGTHGLDASEQNMPLMKWRFVSNTGAVSFEKNAIAVAHIPANQRPGGTPAQDGDTWYKPLAIWVNTSGQGNPFYTNSPNLVSCWFERWGDEVTDHVFVKYNGRYYDGSYEHTAGASYATINAKADAGISDYYYESKLVYEASSGGFVDKTATMANDQIWMGPGGFTGAFPLLKVPNDLAKDEMEEP
jgi:hypothetical protein